MILPKFIDNNLTPRQRYIAKNLRRWYVIVMDNLLEGNLKKVWHLGSRRLWAKIKGYPTGIALEINSACNLKCVFCWSRKNLKRSTSGFMKKEDAMKIIDDIAPYCSWVCPYFQGEPLMHPDLVEILDYANKKGLMTEISTNAMLLTEEKVRQLIDIKLDSVVLSFDGASAESYEKNRVGAKFETVKKNILALTRIREELGSMKPHILIQMIVTKDNKHEINAFKKLAMEELGVDDVFLRNLSLANTTPKQETEAIKTLLPDGTYELVEGHTVEDPGRRCDKRVPIVTQDGTVGICCYDINAKYGLGNAITQHLIKDIWLSPKYVKLRKGLQWKMQLDICKQCRYSFHEIPTKQYMEEDKL